MSHQELKECYQRIDELNQDLEAAKSEISALREQLAFTKEYLNPKDTSFRQMVDNFMTLSNEDKDKIIDLSRAMAALNKGGG